MIRGDQFIPRRRVHTVEAGRNCRRAADADVDFSCASIAHHAHDFAAGCAAHDGIVHKDDALAFDHPPDRVEFESDAEIANGLLRLDKGTANVVIANQSHAESDSGFCCIADRSGHAGIRNGHHGVCLDWMFARQLPPEALAAFIHLPTKNDAVWARKIYVLEYAVLMRFFGSEVD